jgi:hypothetical protein
VLEHVILGFENGLATIYSLRRQEILTNFYLEHIRPFLSSAFLGSYTEGHLFIAGCHGSEFETIELLDYDINNRKVAKSLVIDLDSPTYKVHCVEIKGAPKVLYVGRESIGIYDIEKDCVSCKEVVKDMLGSTSLFVCGIESENLLIFNYEGQDIWVLMYDSDRNTFSVIGTFTEEELGGMRLETSSMVLRSFSHEEIELLAVNQKERNGAPIVKLTFSL